MKVPQIHQSVHNKHQMWDLMGCCQTIIVQESILQEFWCSLFSSSSRSHAGRICYWQPLKGTMPSQNWMVVVGFSVTLQTAVNGIYYLRWLVTQEELTSASDTSYLDSMNIPWWEKTPVINEYLSLLIFTIYDTCLSMCMYTSWIVLY